MCVCASVPQDACIACSLKGKYIRRHSTAIRGVPLQKQNYLTEKCSKHKIGWSKKQQKRRGGKKNES